jgi:hypothetical protein
MATTLIPYNGAAIADLDNGTPANRAVDYTNWPATTPTGFVIVHNASDATCYLRSVNTAAVGERGIPAGATAVFGPYARATALWLYGLGAGSAYVSFDGVLQEQP